MRQHAEPGTFCLCFAGEGGALPVPSVEYGAAQNGADQAKHLFTALRQLDERARSGCLPAAPPPPVWRWQCITGLLRAAAFRVVEA